MARQTRAERVDHANRLVDEIAARGRRFFFHGKSGRTARFELTQTGRVRYRDEFSDCLIDVARSGRWMNFSGGGTLQQLVRDLGLYVAKGAKIDRRHFGPWAQWRCDGDVWGYGFDAMEELRAAIADSDCLRPVQAAVAETSSKGENHVAA